MVSTPIGNLGDITLRALKILGAVEWIAAESVDHTRALCESYGIKTRLTAYNQHNRKIKGPQLLRRLKSGQDVALVTSAGAPGVSDPGMFLVDQALYEDIRVSPVPGPSAVTAALSAAGLRAERFLFFGFLSPKRGKRRKDLKGLEYQPYTMVFFEAPHRLVLTLEDMLEILGDRPLVILKEMTKMFEQTLRGSLRDLLERIRKEGETRGEYTLVMEGSEKREQNGTLQAEIEDRIDRMLETKTMSIRDMAQNIASEAGLDYRSIYKACIKRKRAL
ncbi:MAG: 16S rRNA (cytidine(1402)-2'-O)-methyltransferase [Deltaproteobacteria bacterium]|nr:16S rRNA (cytidine(1402)-2'-O)-methyltransferase [Deltaproteobacteria bacterium]